MMHSADEHTALDLDELLSAGAEVWLTAAGALQTLGPALPGSVARWMCIHPDPSEREHLAVRLHELYALVDGAEASPLLPSDSDWIAGLALALELLVGDLPDSLRTTVGEQPSALATKAAASEFWFRVPVLDSPDPQHRFAPRLPHTGQRFLIGAPPATACGADIEHNEGWALSGPPIADRAHTLMLALLRAGLLRAAPEIRDGPVGAAGVWLPGERVGPIPGMVERARGWREANPNGLLISGSLDLELRETPHSKGQRFGRDAGLPDGPWIAGTTLTEIRAKLGAEHSKLMAWDGEPMRHVIPLTLSLPFGDRPDGPRWGTDPLLVAAHAAARGEQGRRGVLIDGGPGSGKSVLSRTLIERFLRGPLGTLGFAVRCDARRLARRLDDSDGRWSTALAAESEHPEELLATLEEGGRLVPVVDGLDELQPDQLAAVARWLESGKGWWLATSRPLRGFGPEPPPAWRLTVEPVGAEPAAAFLRSRGRDDLAEAIANGRSDAPWANLVDTPLRLALLARTVKQGQALADFDARTLYATAFEVQLRRGCRAGRLSPADARWLKQVVGRAVGEMALTWLDSPDGALDARGLESAFERAGMGLEHQERAVAALEEGRLLAPLGAHWEFAHRTIAEWAAAEALRRRVDHRCRGASSQSAMSAERVVLDGLSTHREPPGSSRWRTVLRFYAPLCRSPLALLDWLVGPAQVPTWRVEDRARFEFGRPKLDPEPPPTKRRLRSSEALNEWSFAFEVLTLCRWAEPADARAAWAIAARRWIVATDAFDVGRGTVESGAAALAIRVSGHLPRDLSALARLAGRTESQRARLTSHPLDLLPAVPPTHAALVWPYLDSDDPARVAAALAWGQQWDQPAPIAQLSSLARSTPNRTTHSDAWSSVAETVWNALLDQDVELPWPAVLARIGQGLSYRDSGAVRWFAALPRSGDSPSVDELYRRRRRTLEPLVRAVSVALDEIDERLATASDSETRTALLARFRHLVRDKDDRHLWSIVSKVAERRGWSTPEAEAQAGSEEARPIVQAARRYWDLSLNLDQLVGKLAPPAINAIVGQLWQDLSTEATARRVLLDALRYTSRLPDVVPPMVALAAGWHGSHDFTWTADQRAALEQAAARGPAAARWTALEALAQTDGTDLAATAFALLPSGDPDLDARIVDFLGGRGAYRDALLERGFIERPPPTLDSRASEDAPGWRDELLDRLAEPADDGLHSLIELAERYGVRAALPWLVGHLENESYAYSLVPTIARMATEADADLVRPVVRYALAKGWPSGRNHYVAGVPDGPDAGEALARFLRVDDLDALADSETEIDRHPALADALRALAPESTTRLLAVHAERAAVLARLQAAYEVTKAAAREADEFRFDADASNAIWHARRRLQALTASILASLDPTTTPLARAVEVATTVLVPAQDETYRSLGDNGIDQKQIARVLACFEARLAVRDDEWSAIEPLLAHPADRVRLFAFETLADHVGADDIVPLGIQAIEHHLTAIDYATKLRQGWRWGRPPRIDSQLVKAIGARLTQAHYDALRAFSGHEAPAIRALAARWAGEVHAPRGSDWLVALLADPHVEVVEAAMDALFALAPDLLPQSLLDLDDCAWSPAHDEMLLKRFVARPGPYAQDLHRWVPAPPDALAGEEWTDVLRVHLARAAEREACLPQARCFYKHTCFDGFPSEAELALEAWQRRLGGAAIDLCRDWLTHGVPTVRTVARRLWMTHGAHPVADLQRWLNSPEPMDRLSAAECIVRQGEATLTGPANAVLRGVLVQHPAPSDRAAAGFDPHVPDRPERDYTGLNGAPDRLEPSGPFFEDLRNAALTRNPQTQDRLRGALRTSTADFAPLLRFVAAHIPFDNQEMVTTDEGDAIIADVTVALERWGVSGVAPLVRLFDEGMVATDPAFTNRVEQIARASDAGRQALRDLASAGNSTATEMLRSIAKADLEEDVSLLVGLLEERVFPPGWRARFAINE